MLYIEVNVYSVCDNEVIIVFIIGKLSIAKQECYLCNDIYACTDTKKFMHKTGRHQVCSHCLYLNHHRLLDFVDVFMPSKAP